MSSETYAEQQRRKEICMFLMPAHALEKTFEGRLIEEREGGRHSVFRYEKALFLGVIYESVVKVYDLSLKVQGPVFVEADMKFRKKNIF